MAFPPAAACRACGCCCRAVSLDLDLVALGRLAAEEEARLMRQPHTPHRAAIERLVRDVAFLRRHFRSIEREAAVQRQPSFAHPDFDGRHFFFCDALGADGRCAVHGERPYLCEGYPWYLGRPQPGLLVHRPCGYERECAADEVNFG